MSQATGPDPNPETQTGPRLRGGLHQRRHRTILNTHAALYDVHRDRGAAGDRVVHERESGEGRVYMDVVYVVLVRVVIS